MQEIRGASFALVSGLPSEITHFIFHFSYKVKLCAHGFVGPRRKDVAKDKCTAVQILLPSLDHVRRTDEINVIHKSSTF